MTVQRDGTLPLYRQLIEELEGRIADGAWLPDDRLPSEGALAAAFGVHRLTVRHALADLARRGMIRTEQGRGSFVGHPVIRYEVGPGHAASFTRAMQAAGRGVELRLLRTVQADDAPAELAALGAVRRDDTLRVVDGIPWSVSSTWLPARRFPDLATHWRGDASLYDVLTQRYGVAMVRRARTFAAALADTADAEHLGVSPGAPVLLVRGLNVDAAGAPVAVVAHRFRGDRVQFTVELGR